MHGIYSKTFIAVLIASLTISLPGFAAPPLPQHKPPLRSDAPDPSGTNLPLDVTGTSYFPVLPIDAEGDVPPQYVPIATSHPLDGDHAGLTHAIIVLHDFTRNAQESLAEVSSLAGANNDQTIIVAPQFLLDFDITRFANQLPDKGAMFARWALGAWENGGDSLPQPPLRSISSFTVVDLLALFFADKQSFPDMQEITIVGHGTGGDFVQRYTALGRALPILEKQGLPVNFLVANPSSYLYFTSYRRKPGKNPAFYMPKDAACPGFNTYGYGLDKLNDYGRRVGANAAKTDYPTRHVTYLLGDKVAGTDPLPDTSCAANMQGNDRLSRSANYRVYLSQLFGDQAAANHVFMNVPKVGYSPAAMFGSTCGMSVLFGDGVCKTATFGQ